MATCIVLGYVKYKAFTVEVLNFGHFSASSYSAEGGVLYNVVFVVVLAACDYAMAAKSNMGLILALFVIL